MPGYADWKTLYREELFQMREEGYDLPEDLYTLDEVKAAVLRIAGKEAGAC